MSKISFIFGSYRKINQTFKYLINITQYTTSQESMSFIICVWSEHLHLRTGFNVMLQHWHSCHWKQRFGHLKGQRTKPGTCMRSRKTQKYYIIEYFKLLYYRLQNIHIIKVTQYLILLRSSIIQTIHLYTDPLWSFNICTLYRTRWTVSICSTVII